MKFLQRLREMFFAPSPTLEFKVRCQRCGEVISGRISRGHELSATYGNSDQIIGYYSRKVVMGEGSGEKRCFQQVEVEFTFDARRRLKDKTITGGQFIED